MNDERLSCDVFPTVLSLRSCPVRLILGNNETRACRKWRKYEQIVVRNRRETTQGGISAVTDIALQRKKQKKREA